MQRTVLLLVLACRVSYSVGCDCGGELRPLVPPDSGQPDSGAPNDAGGADSGTPDSGVTPPDAGPADSGAGDAGADGGPNDAGFAAIALVQTASGTLFITAPLVLPQPVQVGDLLLVMVAFDQDAGVAFPSDTLGNSFALALRGGNGDTHLLYYSSVVHGGSDAVRVAGVSMMVDAGILVQVLEYQGISASAPLDQTTEATGSGSTASASLAATSHNELVYAFCGSASVLCATVGPGLTLRLDSTGDESADEVAADAGTYQAIFAMQSAGPWDVVMATFRGE